MGGVRRDFFMTLFVTLTASILASGAMDIQRAPTQGRLVGRTGLGAPVVWVQFQDKGHADTFALRRACETATTGMDVRRKVRMDVRAGVSRLEYVDLPLCNTYVEQVAALGAKVRVRSRWFNAVSVRAAADTQAVIAQLPFVAGLFALPPSRPLPDPNPEAFHSEEPGRLDIHTLNYGQSAVQNSLIQTNVMHDLGFSGAGVRIGILDTGFNWRQHPALSGRTVIREYDFVDNDNDPSGNLNQHGTAVFSAIAGFAPGQLIGPAYGAEYLLARTEADPAEEPYEEDFFVAGLEWCEENGADIVTASLGYIDWYTQDDLNGVSSVTAQGCNLAGQRGLLILTAAGNAGPTSPSLITPSDSPYVLAVGAVNSAGSVVSFSSRGPTADGRIKPDVLAMGSGVRIVDTANPGLFTSGSGTSFATPLAAGAAALLLQARPLLSATDARILLRATATRNSQPDVTNGWGLVQTHAAYLAQVPPSFPMPDLDYDDDFLRNDREAFPGNGLVTNAWLPDSDGDGLLDGREDSNRNGTRDTGELNPLAFDSDGDRLEDAIEQRVLGSDPLSATSPGALPDTDADGLPLPVDPNDNNPDTDGDGYDDGYEAGAIGLGAENNPLLAPTLGDLNRDTYVTNLDALAIQAVFLVVLGPDAMRTAAGDPTRDALVTNLDALLIQSRFLGLRTTLPLR